MTNNEKNHKIEQARGKVPCNLWGFAFGDYMMKGECGHKDCYPAQRPTEYTEYLGAIITAENELVTDEDTWLTILSAHTGKAPIPSLRYATAEQRTDALLEYLLIK